MRLAQRLVTLFLPKLGFRLTFLSFFDVRTCSFVAFSFLSPTRRRHCEKSTITGHDKMRFLFFLVILGCCNHLQRFTYNNDFALWIKSFLKITSNEKYWPNSYRWSNRKFEKWSRINRNPDDSHPLKWDCAVNRRVRLGYFSWDGSRKSPSLKSKTHETVCQYLVSRRLSPGVIAHHLTLSPKLTANCGLSANLLMGFETPLY